MKTTTNILILLSISNLAFSQVDGLTHTAGGANWYVGWDNTIPSSTVPLVIQHQGQQPIQFWHNDLNLGNTVIRRAEFTVGQSMLENNGTVARTDGLRIWNPGYANSVAYGAEQALDIWTGVGNSTHIRFDGSGLLQSTNNQFEIFGRLNGFWFNAAPLQWQQNNFRSNYVWNIDSIEVGRYSNSNNAQRGFMRWGLQPNPVAPVDAARRVEIYDRDNVPQFRITQTNASIFTDFQTTLNGDLYINPVRNGTYRFVGINTASPQNTLEINSNANYAAGQPGASGLRFTDLRLGSQEGTSNGKVLSVDNNGDVILVRDIGGGSVNSTCTTQDIIARFDNTGNVIQCSDIYNNAASTSNNRIGFFTTNPRYKFQCEGTSFFTTNQVTPLTPNYGLQHPNSPVIIDSKSNEGLSILHTANGYNKDLMRIYGDNNMQYHIRMVGTPTGMNVANSLTIEHEDNGGNIESWLAFDPGTNTCVMQGNYSGSIPGNHSKLYVEAQNPIPTSSGNNMFDAIRAVNTNTVTVSTTRLTGVNAECVGTRLTAGQPIYNIGGAFKGSGANSSSSSNAFNYGVSGEAFGNNSMVNNYGGFFRSLGTGYSNCGVYSIAQNVSQLSFGIYTSARGGTSVNYGIYALSLSNNCINGNCSSAAGFFNGRVYATNNYYHTSDSTLKQNIVPAPQSDTLLNNLSIYKFNYDTLNNYGLSLEGGTHYGVIAQEVQQVLPQLVKNFLQPAEYDSSGAIISQQKDILAVNYTEFIPLLIAGYKSQAKEIYTLTSQLTTLQSRLDSLVMAVASCCNAPLLNQNNSSNQQTIELDNTPAIILGNDPNPFAENTTISWNIPQQDTKTINAMLVFYNQNGSILKSVKIHQAGAGSLLVYGSNLSSGQYSYSLVVNNKTIKTKQMVKVK